MRPLTYCHSEIRKQRPAFQSGPQGTDTPSRPKVTTCETFHSDGERLEGYVTSYKGHLVSKCKSPLDARTARLVEPHPTTGGPQGGTGSNRTQRVRRGPPQGLAGHFWDTSFSVLLDQQCPASVLQKGQSEDVAWGGCPDQGAIGQDPELLPSKYTTHGLPCDC